VTAKKRTAGAGNSGGRDTSVQRADGTARADAAQAGAAVIAVRLDGRRVLFGKYRTLAIAESVADNLRRMQLGAEVVDADQVPGAPGATIEAAR
jgi:hypothetical protein